MLFSMPINITAASILEAVMPEVTTRLSDTIGLDAVLSINSNNAVQYLVIRNTVEAAIRRYLAKSELTSAACDALLTADVLNEFASAYRAFLRKASAISKLQSKVDTNITKVAQQKMLERETSFKKFLLSQEVTQKTSPEFVTLCLYAIEECGTIQALAQFESCVKRALSRFHL